MHRLPAPIRIFHDGLTAFSDHFAFYPNPRHDQKRYSYGIALLSLSGPRESVRAIQSALFMGSKVHALLPDDRIIEVEFKGYRDGEGGDRYGRTFSHVKGTALHQLIVSMDTLEGRVAFGRDVQAFNASLEQKLAEHLPFPTHPLWANWWIKTLHDLEYLVPLTVGARFYATLFRANRIHKDSEHLFALLKAALKTGQIPKPTPDYADEEAA